MRLGLFLAIGYLCSGIVLTTCVSLPLFANYFQQSLYGVLALSLTVIGLLSIGQYAVPKLFKRYNLKFKWLCYAIALGLTCLVISFNKLSLAVGFVFTLSPVSYLIKLHLLRQTPWLLHQSYGMWCFGVWLFAPVLVVLAFASTPVPEALASRLIFAHFLLINIWLYLLRDYGDELMRGDGYDFTFPGFSDEHNAEDESGAAGQLENDDAALNPDQTQDQDKVKAAKSAQAKQTRKSAAKRGSLNPSLHASQEATPAADAALTAESGATAMPNQDMTTNDSATDTANVTNAANVNAGSSSNSAANARGATGDLEAEGGANEGLAQDLPGNPGYYQGVGSDQSQVPSQNQWLDGTPWGDTGADGADGAQGISGGYGIGLLPDPQHQQFSSTSDVYPPLGVTPNGLLGSAGFANGNGAGNFGLVGPGSGTIDQSQDLNHNSPAQGLSGTGEKLGAGNGSGADAQAWNGFAPEAEAAVEANGSIDSQALGAPNAVGANGIGSGAALDETLASPEEDLGNVIAASDDVVFTLQESQPLKYTSLHQNIADMQNADVEHKGKNPSGQSGLLDASLANNDWFNPEIASEGIGLGQNLLPANVFEPDEASEDNGADEVNFNPNPDLSANAAATSGNQFDDLTGSGPQFGFGASTLPPVKQFDTTGAFGGKRLDFDQAEALGAATTNLKFGSGADADLVLPQDESLAQQAWAQSATQHDKTLDIHELNHNLDPFNYTKLQAERHGMQSTETDKADGHKFMRPQFAPDPGILGRGQGNAAQNELDRLGERNSTYTQTEGSGSDRDLQYTALSQHKAPMQYSDINQMPLPPRQKRYTDNPGGVELAHKQRYSPPPKRQAPQLDYTSWAMPKASTNKQVRKRLRSTGSYSNIYHVPTPTKAPARTESKSFNYTQVHGTPQRAPQYSPQVQASGARSMQYTKVSGSRAPNKYLELEHTDKPLDFQYTALQGKAPAGDVFNLDTLNSIAATPATVFTPSASPAPAATAAIATNDQVDDSGAHAETAGEIQIDFPGAHTPGLNLDGSANGPLHAPTKEYGQAQHSTYNPLGGYEQYTQVEHTSGAPAFNFTDLKRQTTTPRNTEVTRGSSNKRLIPVDAETLAQLRARKQQMEISRSQKALRKGHGFQVMVQGPHGIEGYEPPPQDLERVSMPGTKTSVSASLLGTKAQEKLKAKATTAPAPTSSGTASAEDDEEGLEELLAKLSYMRRKKANGRNSIFIN